MAKIVIIGGGVAGLSAGVYAQMSGHSAVIFEKHSVPGGNLTGWDRGEYHIDNCIHWLTGTNPVTDMYRMWHDLGALGDVDIHRSSALFTFEHNGESLSLWRDADRLKADMLALSPRDEKEIVRFIKALNDAKTIIDVSSRDNHQKATSAELIAAMPLLLRYHQMTTRELAERFHHPVIRGFMRGLLAEDFGALGMLVAYATFCADNGDVPVGASRAMAQRMAERFRSLGGELHCGKGVGRINIVDRHAVSVTLSDGREIKADDVIVATEPAVAFGTLLDQRLMPKALKKLYHHPAVKRFSSVHCAFSCDEASLPFYGDRIWELTEELQTKLRSRYLILREYSHEKSFAPMGKSLIQTMHYCDEEECRRLIGMRKRPKEYREHKQEIVSSIQELITEHFPGLKDQLEVVDCWTPATYQRFTGAQVGSYMGFVFPPKINPLFISGRIKGLKNVFLATQWQQAPGGLPIAAKAGAAAVKEIDRLN